MLFAVTSLEMNVIIQKKAGSEGRNFAAPQKGFYVDRSTASTAKVPPTSVGFVIGESRSSNHFHAYPWWPTRHAHLSNHVVCHHKSRDECNNAEKGWK